MRAPVRASVLPRAVVFAALAAVPLASCSRDLPTTTSRLSPTDGGPAFAVLTDTVCTSDLCAFGRPSGIVGGLATAAAWGVAVTDEGIVWYTDIVRDGVGITNTRKRLDDGFVATGPLPTGITFSPDDRTAYVANQFADVKVLNVATRQIIASIAIPNPLAVQVSPDGSTLYVGTGGSNVVVVNTATRQIVNTVHVGAAPNDFAVHPKGRLLYVSLFLDGTVSELDMRTNAVLRTFTLGGSPQGMALDHKGARLYVANEQGYLNVVDLATGQLGAPIPLAAGGFGVGVTKDDAEAYITLPSAGLVQVFGLNSRKLTKTINVGGQPRRVAFSEHGRQGAITNSAGYITFVK